MLKKHKKEYQEKKKPYKKFLKKFDTHFIPEIEKITAPIEKKTWEKVSCLTVVFLSSKIYKTARLFSTGK